MLRDRLVCGVRDRKVQRRLLVEITLDFKHAFETAVTLETAIALGGIQEDGACSCWSYCKRVPQEEGERIEKSRDR